MSNLMNTAVKPPDVYKDFSPYGEGQAPSHLALLGKQAESNVATFCAARGHHLGPHVLVYMIPCHQNRQRNIESKSLDQSLTPFACRV